MTPVDDFRSDPRQDPRRDASTLPDTAPAGDPWRVGVLFSRSGVTAISESEHFYGTVLAIEEINRAGGVLGRQISCCRTKASA
jgi:ABC-type branched-subunit amino acid transport system substrate-binding protein